MTLEQAKEKAKQYAKEQGSYKCIRIFNPSPQSAYNGIPYIAENAEKIAEELKKHLETQGCKDFEVLYDNDRPHICYFGNQFYRLPNTPKQVEGVLKIKSNRYVLTYIDHKGIEKISYGPKIKKAMLNDTGFTLVIPNGILEYYLGEKLS
jgi:hypothetical protein